METLFISFLILSLCFHIHILHPYHHDNCNNYSIDYSHNVDNIPLNPASPMMEPIVQGFFGEMTNIFVDDYFHIGGDEVVYPCWKQDQSLTKWMQQNHIQV